MKKFILKAMLPFSFILDLFSCGNDIKVETPFESELVPTEQQKIMDVYYQYSQEL